MPNSSPSQTLNFDTNSNPVPIKTYKVATLDARTERGGVVVATCDTTHLLEGNLVACVGDTVRYPDGSESRISTGVAKILVNDRPLAVVGSRLENGDVLVESPQRGSDICEFESDEPLIVPCEMPQ